MTCGIPEAIACKGTVERGALRVEAAEGEIELADIFAADRLSCGVLAL